jgi:hypothetical protein
MQGKCLSLQSLDKGHLAVAFVGLVGYPTTGWEHPNGKMNMGKGPKSVAGNKPSRSDGRFDFGMGGGI